MSAPASALVILQYHHISADTPTVTSTSPALFREHLKIIEESGFEVVDLETVVKVMERRRGAPPENAVLITFDDSYSSIYTTAYPLLKERGWPFVVFANTEPVDRARPGFMTWNQLKEMADNGAAIANHSVNHPHFVRRPADTDMQSWRAQAQREIQSAQARIKTNIGQDYKVLAFPYGEYDAALLDLLEALDFLGMSQVSGAVRPGDGLAMPRFPMGGRYGEPGDFRLKLKALPLPVDEVQLRDEDGRKLDDGLLPKSVTRPILEIRLNDASLNAGLQCYASGQVEPISRREEGKVLVFQADKALPAGRSRYNCTMRNAESGRYHWFSVAFLRPFADGSWPPEP
jgi:peptidoglycan/xylan/chitin deacetylase (PgdA/CDA1 family)